MASESAVPNTDRWFVRCEIAGWVSDDPQPGIVECKLVDASGHNWTFVGKFYDFSNEELSSESVYPQAGYVACKVVKRDAGERGLVEIDTDDVLRGRESEEGRSRFQVSLDQLVLNALPEGHIVPLVKATRQ
jgi:hypothetical protein